MPSRKKTVDKNHAAIYAAIRRVPRGKVCSYGGIAQLAKLPRRARLVGTVLRNTPRSMRLPWFRIVTSSGRLAFPVGSEPFRVQRSHLEREGVKFANNKIDMRRFAWPSRAIELDELLWAPHSR
ncbi:MAG TPA: MGMT family protein [Steroidobacteraceae bacterium]|nr:MGMT family protein [Steroidobacteraceae bacterium]